MNRPIDLLISDIDLSASMNGIDLARELTALNPSIRVLLISGAEHPPSEIPRTWRFLAKPFHVDLFLKQIQPAGPLGCAVCRLLWLRMDLFAARAHCDESLDPRRTRLRLLSGLNPP